MSRGLAIETSGRIGSIAVVDGDAIGEEERFPHGLQHAAQIVPIIDRLCAARGWTPRDVERLYLSVGPGSFTGLRIAVTLAKTMAFATGAKLVAVPSVDVLARNAPSDARHVIIVLDAKRDQIFTARFERTDDGQWHTREPAHLDRLPDMLARAPRPVHLIGEGLPYHERHLVEHDPGVILTPPEAWRARATAVAGLGLALAEAGKFTDPYTLRPIYIRLPEAEEKWLAAQGQPRAG